MVGRAAPVAVGGGHRCGTSPQSRPPIYHNEILRKSEKSSIRKSAFPRLVALGEMRFENFFRGIDGRLRNLRDPCRRTASPIDRQRIENGAAAWVEGEAPPAPETEPKGHGLFAVHLRLHLVSHPLGSSAAVGRVEAEVRPRQRMVEVQHRRVEPPLPRPEVPELVLEPPPLGLVPVLAFFGFGHESNLHVHLQPSPVGEADLEPALERGDGIADLALAGTGLQFPRLFENGLDVMVVAVVRPEVAVGVRAEAGLDDLVGGGARLRVPPSHVCAPARS